MRLINRVIVLGDDEDVVIPDDAITIYWTTDSHIWPESVGGPGEDPNAPNALLGDRYYYTAPSKTRHFVDEVAAAEQVDLVVHTGDMLERDTDWTTWQAIWAELDPSLPQILVAGNHDFVDSDYATVIAGLGRSGEPMVAGSQMNRSFNFSKGGYSYRMIVADTNMDASGTHMPITAGIFTQDVLDWIEAEIAAAAESDIIIWTHHSIHEYTGGHFTEASALALKDIVDDAVALRADLSVTCLFGHYHNRNLRTWHTLGSNLPGYSCAAAVEFESTHYAVVHAWDAHVVVDEFALEYPHA